MHDDTNIRNLRPGGNLHVVGTESEVARGDEERRVHRRDGEPTQLELVPDAQADDLEPRVRELPIDGAIVMLRNEMAVLKQEHKDLDDSIHALQLARLPDQILLARLKRKKLALRDRIATLEDKIRPDIIA